jgi:hypothetical protein
VAAAAGSSIAGVTALLALLVAGAVLAPQTAAAAKAKARPATHAQSVLPWIEDDYERAIVDAKARSVPIFVESWAPW